ncbi:MAG TPA: hypothetical protein VFW11_17425 [Cyclobacteriaceae bacterium]|nr:hypothetical protein [Cyclobacteriaceae bacterium]
MNSVVLIDHGRFDDFLKNHVVDAFVVAHEDSQRNFNVKDIIEVWYKATSTSRYGRYLAVIVRNFGPSVQPCVLKIKIQKLGNWN